MDIETFITEIEEHHLSDALEKLSKNPKDLVMIYLNSLEFKRAKLMRGNAVPTNEEENERDIYVSIHRGVEDNKKIPEVPSKQSGEG